MCADHFLIGLTDAGGARLLVVDASAAAVELQERHSLQGHAAVAASEGLVAAQLMSAYIKGEERITLQVQMESPRFAMIVDVNADGTTRGRFTPAHIPRSRPLQGAIMVIKHDAERELYRGVAPVEGTDFQGALHSYLVRSQQSEGVVRIDVALGDDGRVVSASGLLVEKLPDQDSAVFRDLFGDLAQAELAPVLAAAAAGELWGFPLRILESRALRFACRCSHERSLGVLAMVGAGELHELLDDQGGAELTCNFCMEVYHFDADDLRGLIKALEGDA